MATCFFVTTPDAKKALKKDFSQSSCLKLLHNESRIYTLRIKKSSKEAVPGKSAYFPSKPKTSSASGSSDGTRASAITNMPLFRNESLSDDEKEKDQSTTHISRPMPTCIVENLPMSATNADLLEFFKVHYLSISSSHNL